MTSNKGQKELSDFGINILENIGRNVKFTRRKLLNVTLYEFAENTGVSRDVICRLEDLAKGENVEQKTYPSIKTLIKFCEGVGVTPSDLFEKDFEKDDDIQNDILEHCKGFRKSDKNVISLDD